MIIRKNILKTAAAVFLIISIIATIYINKFLAPTWLKDLLVKNISQAVDRPVSLKSVHLNPLRGFVVKGLVFYEPDGKTEFMRIERLTTSLLLIPLFNERKILIPSIRILAPSAHIVKNQDNTWNFAAPPLLKPAQPALKDKKGFGVLVQNIIIENGEINFTDNTRAPAYNKVLTDLDGAAAYSAKENAVKFKAACRFPHPSKTAAGIEGAYLIKEKGAMAKIAIKNLPLAELYNYFYKLNLIANLKSGEADAILDIKVENGKKIGIACESLVKNLDISYYDLNLKGDLGLTGTAGFDFAETFKHDFKAQLDLKGATLKGLYILNEISGIRGAVAVSKDGISCSGLQGQAYNTPIKFTGGIKSTDDPQFGGRLDIENLDLANLKNFLPEDLGSKLSQDEITGMAGVQLTFHKRFKDPSPVAVRGKAILKDASFKTPGVSGGFEKISGGLIFKNDVLYLSRISFEHGPQAYLIDAKITDFKIPDMKMRLKSKGLLVDARLKLPPDSVHVLRASGNYFNSAFKVSGTIDDLKNPQLSLNGSTNLDMTDLRTLLPDISEGLTRFDVKGIFSADFSIKGPWKEFRSWNAVITGRSDRISIWDIKFDTVKLDLKIRQNALFIPELSAKPYGGTFFATMEMDLTQPNPPYAAEIALGGIDLNKLIVDTDLKGRQMSGTASAKATLRGYGKNTETIKGEGALLIKGSYLWEMPLLKGLADLLFLPNLSSIVFEEVSGDFVIKNNAITTADLGFHSNGVSLLAEGGMTFDGNLDFMMTTSISEDFVKGTSEFQRLASLLFAKAGQLLGNIKITGTIKKPEYKFVPLGIDNALPDKIKGLLGGFF